MKKLIFTLLSFCLIYAQSNAQACGNSGPGVCSPTGALAVPGLEPASDQLAPVYNGSSCSVTIQFQNFDTITFGGSLIHVNSLTIDKISNLPGGACWATNKSDDQFTTNENGCIAVTFTNMNAAPGQYQLGIYVTVATQELGTLPDISAGAAGLYYYVRVNNTGDLIAAIDTTGQAQSTADSIQLYGNPAAGGSGVNCDSTILDSTYAYYVDTLYKSTVGIYNVNSDIQGLSVNPNPFNQSSVVLFSSVRQGNMTEKLIDVLGRTIWSRPMHVLLGTNQSKIDRNSLPAGIYFYSIGDEHSLGTQRVIVTE